MQQPNIHAYYTHDTYILHTAVQAHRVEVELKTGQHQLDRFAQTAERKKQNVDARNK